MSDDVVGLLELRRGRNIDNGHIVGQFSRPGVIQEPLVFGLEVGHCQPSRDRGELKGGRYSREDSYSRIL